jgi:DNA polymerase-1
MPMTVLLLDAHNLLFRSFVTLPASITARGKPVHALYGMLAAVLRLMRELEPVHIVAAFDVPSVPTFRHELYPAYQGQRGPLGGEQADEFSRQVEMAMDALPKLGLPALAYPGYEADDIIGTLACGCASDGGRAVMVSTDRDLLQLLRPGIEVMVPGKVALHIRDAAGARARLGVDPEGVTTFKALAGDASDNIPGVAGIGAKTAVALVDEYGDLDTIYSRVDELPPRVARALEQGRDDAYLFRRIVTLVTDLKLAVDPRTLPTPRFEPDSKVRDLLAQAGYGPET